MNILFVCTGNTCRSPMAEGYLRFKNKNINVESCGLSADGSRVSENSEKVMAEIGIDISNHISQQINADLINWADKIICMSHSHSDMLASMGIKTEVLGNGICDPFGCGVEIYQKCRDSIITEIDRLFDDFTVCEITSRHIAQITRLEEVCFSTPWSSKAIEDAYKTGTTFFVAEKDGVILGYVGISAIIDEGYITNVAVFPEYRNKGVASALLRQLFSFAKEKNLSFISLEVRESNSNAISLYNKFGFKQEGKRKNFYTHPNEDALILTRRFD